MNTTLSPRTSRSRISCAKSSKRDEEREDRSHSAGRTYSGPIRVLLENPSTCSDYSGGGCWDPSSDYNWRKGFESNREKIRIALEERNVLVVFSEVFRRLYELRNQVFHGGVTFADGWGQTQLRDGTRIMADIVPVILDIMQADIDANPASEIWGKVAYPRIGESEFQEP